MTIYKTIIRLAFKYRSDCWLMNKEIEVSLKVWEGSSLERSWLRLRSTEHRGSAKTDSSKNSLTSLIYGPPPEKRNVRCLNNLDQINMSQSPVIDLVLILICDDHQYVPEHISVNLVIPLTTDPTPGWLSSISFSYGIRAMFSLCPYSYQSFKNNLQ